MRDDRASGRWRRKLPERLPDLRGKWLAATMWVAALLLERLDGGWPARVEPRPAR